MNKNEIENTKSQDHNNTVPQILIAEKLSKIQSELKVPKGKTNKFGGYMYRSAEDILEELKKLNSKYGVLFTVDEVAMEVASVIIIKSTATIIDTGNNQSISASAVVSVELEAKGMHMPQRYGAASSYAKKYALGNLLLIDDTADADATNDHGKSDKKPSLSELKNKIDKSDTVEKLKYAGLSFKKYTLSTEDTEQLQQYYADRMSQLKAL